ncbi:MAG: cyclase family protein, partial [Burkholderiaceae bacterium]
FGYYGGRQDVDVDRGALGIDVLARKGVIGRGVLVDFAGWRDAIGQPVAGDTYAPITPTDIEQTLAWSGTRVLPGDILLLRTGWLRWYLQLSDAGRQALAGKLHNEADGMDAPGLDPGVASAAWLWDHRVAAIAADNPSLEVLRVSRDKGFLHHRILVLLGMPIGEFWYLEELAAACQARGRADFLLSAAPINLPRGVGSPCNACAVL